MKVYLLNNGGSYSDYGVWAIFATEAAAEKARARAGGEVEVYELYEELPPRRTVYVKEFMGVVAERQQVYEAWEGAPYVGTVTRGLGKGVWNNGRWYRFWGTDKARVHKAFDDYHAQRQAELAGVA